MTNREKTNELLSYLKQLQVHQKDSTEERLHVDEIFGAAYFAFEQVRNAAEYSEQHLLMRRSIERYLKRNVDWSKQNQKPIGHSLIAELTQSRYIKNDSISLSTIDLIDAQLDYYKDVYTHSVRYRAEYKQDIAKWVRQIASTHLEKLIMQQSKARDGFLGFAYRHFSDAIHTHEYDSNNLAFQKSLYIAVQRALLRSDTASVRYQMYTATFFYNQMSPSVFVQMNLEVDELFRSQLTNKLTRLVDRNGAALRVVKDIIEAGTDLERLIQNESELKKQVESVLLQKYSLVDVRLRQGIIRSVAFIFVTKIIVGVAIEIPYDLWRHGAIDYLPLIINIFFPPLYMASLGLAIQKPNEKNIETVKRNVMTTLFDTKTEHFYRLEERKSQWSSIFNVAYGLTFFVSIGLLVYLLQLLGFNFVQAAIFFTFLSAVSFFSVRLVDSTKDYVALESSLGLRDLLFNVFMTPFIKIGQKLSDTYAQINFITYILDFAIEMPLKMSLAFVREWSQFLQGKRDRL